MKTQSIRVDKKVDGEPKRRASDIYIGWVLRKPGNAKVAETLRRQDLLKISHKRNT